MPRVAAGVQLLLAGLVSFGLLRLDVPVAVLARHGAWPWAVVTVGLMVWPLVLLVTYRSPSLWTGAVAVWALTTCGVAARLHRWMTWELWLLAAGALLVSAFAAGLAWRSPPADA